MTQIFKELLIWFSYKLSLLCVVSIPITFNKSSRIIIQSKMYIDVLENKIETVIDNRVTKRRLVKFVRKLLKHDKRKHFFIITTGALLQSASAVAIGRSVQFWLGGLVRSLPIRIFYNYYLHLFFLTLN